MENGGSQESQYVDQVNELLEEGSDEGEDGNVDVGNDVDNFSLEAKTSFCDVKIDNCDLSVTKLNFTFCLYFSR